jgi:hypothetical protein
MSNNKKNIRLLNIITTVLSMILLISCGTRASLNKDTLTKVRKVLITGFYDWKELGIPAQLNRCRDNPSCRVLANEGIDTRNFNGPLAKTLKEWSREQAKLKIDFKLLTVTWKDLDTLNLTAYDQVIHLGLGVYDQFHKILIENGAYNLHKGTDALGDIRASKIDESQSLVLKPPSQVSEGISHVLTSKLPSPFQVLKASARVDNTYLCNATHYRSLSHIVSLHTLQEAYFIHIPHRQGKSDHALATALFHIIKVLIDSSETKHKI